MQSMQQKFKRKGIQIMVKNRVMLTGVLVAGLMGAHVQASDYVHKAKAPLTCFATVSVLRSSLLERRFPVGCKVQQRFVGTQKEQAIDQATTVTAQCVDPKSVDGLNSLSHTARLLRVGSYGFGFSTPNSAQTWGQKVKGLRPAFDGFTPSNIATDAVLAAALWYGIQKFQFQIFLDFPENNIFSRTSIF